LLFEALVVLSWMLSGGFWFAASAGRTVVWPWQTSQAVPESDLREHQARWNRNAAFCAAIASVLQALLFLYDRWLPSFIELMQQKP
jgi:hypothetical protein